MTTFEIHNLDIGKRAYSIDEISEQTSLSKSFLRKEIRLKNLKARRFGRRVLVLASDLESYLEGAGSGDINTLLPEGPHNGPLTVGDYVEQVVEEYST